MEAGLVFYNFCTELCFPKARHCQALPGASSQKYHASTRRKDREQTWTWSTVTLGTFSSLWTFIAPGSPGQDRCLCLAALKVYIAQFNQNFLPLKTLAFPVESCVTNSTTLPGCVSAEPWPFLSKAFIPALLLAAPSLPSQLSSRLKSVRCGNIPHSFRPPCHPPSPAPSPSCGRGKDALDLATVSHVPTAELAAPSGGSPESRPCFSGNIAPSSPGGGFGTGLCFAEGGLRSKGGAGGCGGSSASSQHRSVCSSYFYPQGQQLYLSRMPQEPKVLEATSVLRKNTIWMSFILPTFSKPYSPSPGLFATSSALFMSH